MSLEKLRKIQEQIDLEILKLLAERFEISKKIAKTKLKNNIDIENLDLEEKKIKNLQSSSKLSKNFVEKLWRSIFKESKKIQKDFID